MPLIETKGAASAQGFGEFAASSGAVTYIEDVFSTYLYTGNGSTQTITNGIDISGKGALIWSKRRDAAGNHFLQDTAQGAAKYLQSDSSNAAGGTTGVTFSSSGYSMDSSADMNISPCTYASWTFREQPKFFDVVTWTGNGANYRAISHSLGSTPGCVIVKSTSASGAWAVWHRSTDPNNLILNSTSAAISGQYSIQDVGSTSFAVASSSFYGFPQSIPVNDNGATYVAYLFAHNAGGFGLTGSDNVISCGSFTSSGIGLATVDLGYEPQWILYKGSNGVTNWQMVDNMRGFVVGAANAGTSYLNANTSGAEATTPPVGITNTGFNFDGAANITYIYIAIRRGPMKVPTSGTSVYSGVARTGTGAAATVTGVGFSPDLIIGKPRTGFAVGTAQFDRLRGTSVYLAPSWTDAEITDTTMVTSFNMDGVSLGADTVQKYFNGSGGTYANWMFKRAPSFFDEVCYTGTGSANTAFNHNLTVTPELMIVKPRSAATAPNWRVWSPINSTDFNLLQLSTNGAASSSAYSSSNVFPAAPTATTFTVGGSGSIQLNESGQTFVAYLFATCAGVSKVFSYTGNGSSQTINCGFTGGARWILIKRTDSTGDWYVWDSAMGIVSGNDPHLSLNTADAEVTTDDTIDTDSTGFVVNQVSATNVNVSSATYIGIAIA